MGHNPNRKNRPRRRQEHTWMRASAHKPTGGGFHHVGPRREGTRAQRLERAVREWMDAG